jgi:hypothetical protein
MDNVQKVCHFNLMTVLENIHCGDGKRRPPSFIDVDIPQTWWPTGPQSLPQSHTHTNLYLHADSHHHPSNKQAVLSTLVHRARALCDHESLHDELEFLRDTSKRNGYGDRQIRRALDPLKGVATPPEKPISVAFLPLVSTTFNRICRMLSRHSVKFVGFPLRKIPNFLRPMKVDLRLKTPGTYSIPCQTGKVCIVQTDNNGFVILGIRGR